MPFQIGFITVRTLETSRLSSLAHLTKTLLSTRCRSKTLVLLCRRRRSGFLFPLFPNVVYSRTKRLTSPVGPWFQPSTIAQAPILRTSPLGIFLRKSALRINKMGFEELAEWCKEVERWFNGGGRGAQLTSGKR